jgi:hypothetical protein
MDFDGQRGSALSGPLKVLLRQTQSSLKVRHRLMCYTAGELCHRVPGRRKKSDNKGGVQMRRLVGVLAVLAILSTVVAGAYAAPEVATGAVGPYEGAFQGVAYAGEGSRAPLALELTHRGNQVEGTVFLGEGLYVDGGMCGAVNVPATALAIGGQTVLGDPRRLVTRPTFDLGDFEIAVDFESDLSVDGKVITAEATIDLPWFSRCSEGIVKSGISARSWRSGRAGLGVLGLSDILFMSRARDLSKWIATGPAKLAGPVAVSRSLIRGWMFCCHNDLSSGRTTTAPGPRRDLSRAAPGPATRRASLP